MPRRSRSWLASVLCLASFVAVEGGRAAPADVKADVAEGGHEWVGIAKPASAPEWVADAASVTVPVTIWHGQQERLTSITEVRSLAATLPLWSVSSVSGARACRSCSVVAAWSRYVCGDSGSTEFIIGSECLVCGERAGGNDRHRLEGHPGVL